MKINQNIIILGVILMMSLGTWLLPEKYSAETVKNRILAPLTDYQTSTIRMAIIASNCKDTTRSDLISTDEAATSQGYKDQLAAQFTLNGNDFINGYLTDKDLGKVATEAQKDVVPFALFSGFFILGLFFLMTSWCFLICCCCCPGCCPSKCCQKNENEQYTKCELYWPSVTLILALLVIVAGSAIGFSKANAFANGLGDATCAASIMLDDVVNGNVTLDGNNFFIGISNLVTEVGNLNGNLTDIKNNITQLTGASMTNLLTSISTAKTKLSEVPTGTANNGNASISYNTPIDANPTTGTTGSLISKVLGSQGNGGIIGNFWDKLDDTYTLLDGIKTKSSTFSTGAASLDTTPLTDNLDNLKTTINGLSDSLQGSLSILDAPKQMGTMVFQVIYAASMGLAVLTLIGVVLMTFCDKYKCRYLMYFACIFMFFFAIIGFLISFIFSIIIPIMYWGCDWISVTVGSSSGFTTNISPLLDATTAAYITPCLIGGNGDIISQVAPTAATTLNSLSDSVKNSASFNFTDKTAEIDNALLNITTTIAEFVSGKNPDIVDTNQLPKLTKISQSSNAAFSPCSTLTTDSWAVSSDQGTNSYAKCTLSGAHTYVDFTECSTTVHVQAKTNGCVGCIDTTAVLIGLYGSGMTAAGSWKTSLDARYPTGGADTACTTFTTAFGNTWDNYYLKKIPAMNNIQTRWGTADTAINDIKTNLTSLQSTMSTVLGNLQTTVDSVTNAKFGLIAGLNCRLIGEDIMLVVNSICVSNFNTLYITRMAMGIIAFGILISLCCIVCSGVRHFKHSERKDKIAPSFLNSKNSFEDTDAAFKP